MIERLIEIENLLNIEHQELAREASQVSDIFWDHRDKSIENKLDRTNPVLGCRVNDKEGSLRISWFYYKYYKLRNGEVKRTNQHITRAKNSYQYNLSKLYKKALESEQEVVEFCEKRFASIRKQNAILGKMKQQLYYLKKEHESEEE